MSKRKRGAHAFESRRNGSLIIWASMPDGDGEPIVIEAHQIESVIAACIDALQNRPGTR